MMLIPALAAALAIAGEGPTVLSAPKFGLKVEVPSEWKVVSRESGDRVFVATISQADPDRPGVVACEIAVGPENLEEYRTRIDASAKRPGSPGTLVRNEVLKTPEGDRLETLKEFRPSPASLWKERSVRTIKNRQLYTFILNAEAAAFESAAPKFEAMIATAAFSPPNTGAKLADRALNRWVQEEFRFALDLPEGWRPVLRPTRWRCCSRTGRPRGSGRTTCSSWPGRRRRET